MVIHMKEKKIVWPFGIIKGQKQHERKAPGPESQIIYT